MAMLVIEINDSIYIRTYVSTFTVVCICSKMFCFCMYVCEISMKNSDLEYVINILLHGVLVRALIIIHHHLLGLQPLHG